MEKSSLGARLKKDEPMQHHTLLGTGGPADAFIEVWDRESLKEAMSFAAERDVPMTFLGAGSSTVVKDGGVRGMVIKLGREFRGVETSHHSDEYVFVRAGAATPLVNLATFARENGLDGVQGFYDWDGTVGGVLAGFSERCADVVEEVTVIDRDLREMSLTRKCTMPRKAAIISALFKLKRCDVSAKSIGDDHSSAVSDVVKNLPRVFNDVGKQSASSIIVDAGLQGIRVGKMRVDNDDANRFINEGGARSRDAIILINLIKDRIKQSAGINLELAVRIIGED